MSDDVVEQYRQSVIARFQFDLPAATPGADEPPFEDRFEDMMLNASAHHECPEKRVKGRCGLCCPRLAPRST